MALVGASLTSQVIKVTPILPEILTSCPYNCWPLLLRISSRFLMTRFTEVTKLSLYYVIVWLPSKKEVSVLPILTVESVLFAPMVLSKSVGAWLALWDSSTVKFQVRLQMRSLAFKYIGWSLRHDMGTPPFCPQTLRMVVKEYKW